MQEHLCSLENWSDTWLLSCNLDKCMKMHTGPNKKLCNYKLYGKTLSNVKEEKDIVVTIDDDLTFEPHILEIVKKANERCGMFRRNFDFVDAEIFPLLYKTVVIPHLEYAASVWSPRKMEQIKKIEGIERRATKYIPEMSNLTYPERLRKPKLPTLLLRRLRGDLIEVYKS